MVYKLTVSPPPTRIWYTFLVSIIKSCDLLWFYWFIRSGMVARSNYNLMLNTTNDVRYEKFWANFFRYDKVYNKIYPKQGERFLLGKVISIFPLKLSQSILYQQYAKFCLHVDYLTDLPWIITSSKEKCFVLYKKKL